MLSRHYHLAQVNIARMLAPLDSPALADFVAQLAPVNDLADHSPGFVWRLQDATSVRPYDDPMILPNLSVWDSVETLKEFAYKSGHVVPLRDRAKWFERPQQAHLALWWIPAGHIPTVQEAVERLEFRRKHGDTAVAFSIATPYPAPDEPSADPIPPAVNLDQRFFVSAANTPNGDASGDTRFHYRQRDAVSGRLTAAAACASEAWWPSGIARAAWICDITTLAPAMHSARAPASLPPNCFPMAAFDFSKSGSGPMAIDPPGGP